MSRSKKVRSMVERVLGAFEIAAGYGTRRKRARR